MSEQGVQFSKTIHQIMQDIYLPALRNDIKEMIQDQSLHPQNNQPDKTTKYLMYLNALNRAQQAGHKVDMEIKEVISILRVEIGIEKYQNKLKEEAKREAGIFLAGLDIEGIITNEQRNLIKLKIHAELGA